MTVNDDDKIEIKGATPADDVREGALDELEQLAIDAGLDLVQRCDAAHHLAETVIGRPLVKVDAGEAVWLCAWLRNQPTAKRHNVLTRAAAARRAQRHAKRKMEDAQ